MGNAVRDAFTRAARRGGPLFQTFDACLYGGTGPVPGQNSWGIAVDYVFSAPGFVRWRKLDQSHGNAVIEKNATGVLTIFTDWLGPMPVMFRDAGGFWYDVQDGLAADAAGASLSFEVVRGSEPLFWKVEPPPLVNG